MIIQIIIFVIFLFLLAQAIFETILGVSMICQSLFFHSLGFILSGLARLLDGYRWIRKACTVKALPAKARV